MYDNYNGTGMHMALFFTAVLYLLLQKKDEKRYVFLGYTLLFFIICFFPLTAKIIIACIGKTVYWRMFWLLPTVVITAYAGVQVIMAAEKRYGGISCFCYGPCHRHDGDKGVQCIYV